MTQDKISQAQEAISRIHNIRVKRIVFFMVFLVGLGVIGELIVGRIPFLVDNFSWGFLTEMLGAAVTLLIIEVVFQRSEDNNIKGIKAWLDAATEEKNTALEARKQAEEALTQLQQTVNNMQEELQSAQEEASEYKSIAMKAQIDNLNKIMGSFRHILDEHRSRTDPKYAFEKIGQTLLSVTNQMGKSAYTHSTPVTDQNEPADQSSEDK
jgi:hypothetical protein